MEAKKDPERFVTGGTIIMRTKEYLEARKEIINCIVMSPICLFVPLIIIFTEWLPIMRAERNKVAA